MPDQIDKKAKLTDKNPDSKIEAKPPADTPEDKKEENATIVEPKKESLPPSAISQVSPSSETQVINPSPHQEKSPSEGSAKEEAADYNVEEIAPPPVETSHRFAHFKLVAIIVVLVILAGLAVFYFKPLSSLIIKPQSTAQKVSRHMLVPEDEEPTVTDVSDPSKLEVQSFSGKAVEKDQILIYQKSQIAVLYRPSIDKIIAVLDNFTANKEAEISEVPEEKPKNEETKKTLNFVVLNGTGTAGLAKKYQEIVKEKIAGSQIISIGDAKNKAVVKTFIVSLSGQSSAEIASKLEIETGDLPADETKPDADFIIIIGTDKSTL